MAYGVKSSGAAGRTLSSSVQSTVTNTVLVVRGSRLGTDTRSVGPMGKEPTPVEAAKPDEAPPLDKKAAKKAAAETKKAAAQAKKSAKEQAKKDTKTAKKLEAETKHSTKDPTPVEPASPDEAPPLDKKAAKKAAADAQKLEAEAKKTAKAEKKAAKKAEKKEKKEEDKGNKAGKQKPSSGTKVVVVQSKAPADSAPKSWTGAVDAEDSESSPVMDPSPGGALEPEPEQIIPQGPAKDDVAWAPGPEGEAALESLLAGEPGQCTLRRKTKKCIAMYDTGGTFTACARLESKMGKDKCWRLYASPQALDGKLKDVKDSSLGYFGKLTWDVAVVGAKTFTMFDHRGGGAKRSLLSIQLKTGLSKSKGNTWTVKKLGLAGGMFKGKTQETMSTIKSVIKSTKNMVLCREAVSPTSANAVQPIAKTPSGWASPGGAGVVDLSPDSLVEMGKTDDDTWQVRELASTAQHPSLWLFVAGHWPAD